VARFVLSFLVHSFAAWLLPSTYWLLRLLWAGIQKTF
jgi:hypothetical protein